MARAPTSVLQHLLVLARAPTSVLHEQYDLVLPRYKQTAWLVKSYHFRVTSRLLGLSRVTTSVLQADYLTWCKQQLPRYSIYLSWRELQLPRYNQLHRYTAE